MSDNKPIRLGVAGLGTVGTALIDNLNAGYEGIVGQAGRPLEVTAVTARNRQADRGPDLSGVAWADTPEDLARRDDVDIVVELIGGEGDPAYSMIMAALEAGKPVVTANKALLAKHGAALAQEAEANGAALAYEAAVAAAIPAVRTLRDSLAGAHVRAVYGILNGTSNYIVSQMFATGRDFAEVLAEAQEKGYAEADPALDVDGGDAGHKLALLSALAFGVQPRFKATELHGIRDLTLADLRAAGQRGYRIKLLARAARYGQEIAQQVAPCYIPLSHPLAAIDGVTNAVTLDAAPSGPIMLSGSGAGGGATASAVMSDIIELAQGIKRPAFGQPAGTLRQGHYVPMADMLDRLAGSDRAQAYADILQINEIGKEGGDRHDGSTGAADAGTGA